MNPCVDFSAGIVAVPREKDQGSNETIGAARVLNMTGELEMFYIISHILLPLDEKGPLGRVFMQILLLHLIMCIVPPLALTLTACFSRSMGRIRNTVTLLKI
jgi:hypothetical protein